MPLLFMFLAPAITMRLLADEKSSGTLELLITMPVRDWEVVVGKFLAAMALLCTALVLTLVFAITVRALGPLDRGPAIGGYLGLLLMGGAYVAIGVMASAFTRNSIVAFIVAFAISFALFLFGQADAVRARRRCSRWSSFLSIDSHFENISRGVIDTRDVIYYLSVIGRLPAGGDAVARIAAVEVSHGTNRKRKTTPRAPRRRTRPRRRRRRKRVSASNATAYVLLTIGAVVAGQPDRRRACSAAST